MMQPNTMKVVEEPGNPRTQGQLGTKMVKKHSYRPRTWRTGGWVLSLAACNAGGRSPLRRTVHVPSRTSAWHTVFDCRSACVVHTLTFCTPCLVGRLIEGRQSSLGGACDPRCPRSACFKKQASHSCSSMYYAAVNAPNRLLFESKFSFMALIPWKNQREELWGIIVYFDWLHLTYIYIYTHDDSSTLWKTSNRIQVLSIP